MSTIFLILFLLSWAIYQNQAKLLQTLDLKTIGDQYAKSQYVLGDASPQWVGDDIVYQYAASEYKQGKNPTQVNFEHPPLGKYFFSLSLFLFGNTVTINILFYLLFLATFFYLTRIIAKSTVVANFALITLGSLSLIQSHLGETLLDLQMLSWTFLFFAVLFTDTTYKKLKYTILGLCLGALAATKYFFPILGLYFLVFLLYWFCKNKKFMNLVFAASGLFLIYLLSYSAYFAAGHSLIDWLKFELYRFHWWVGNRDFPRFLILHSIYLGKFKAWWDNGTYEYAAHWSLLWPVFCTVHFLLAPILEWNCRKVLLFIFSSLFLTMLALGGANNSRYVLQLIPFWVIFVWDGLKQIYILKSVEK